MQARHSEVRYARRMANKSEPSALGVQLREMRRERGLTAEALAARVPDPALTKTVITNVESGRKRDLTATELLQVASAIGVSPLLLAATAAGPLEPVNSPGLAAPYGEMCLAEYYVANHVVRFPLSQADPVLLTSIRLFEILRQVEAVITVHTEVEASASYAPSDDDDAIVIGTGANEIWIDRSEFSTESWHDRIFDLRMDTGALVREVRAAGRRLPFREWLVDRVNRAIAAAESIFVVAGAIEGPLPRVHGDPTSGYAVGTATDEASRWLYLLERPREKESGRG